MYLLLGVVLFLISCQKAFDYELPDANSKPDTIFPSANFSYASTLEDFKTIKFSNLSFESTTYLWDFGGGNTSSEQDPTFTFDAGEGTYPVTLTASDARGVSDMITIDVMVVEGPFQPIILEPGFEDGTLPDGSGDGRDSWRKSELGGVIQITGDPVTFGDQGAKLPADQTRIGYQEITVETNTNYDLRFWYTMLDDSSDPWLTVSIVGVTEFGPITTPQEALDGTISSVTVNDTSEPAVYVEQKLSFNSGDNNTVAIYFYNGPVEARLDDFSIEVGNAGAVPPSAGFSSTQSSTNYLEYTFTNSSTNAVSYDWDFGDGNSSTEESPTHVYATPDVYTVTLEVTSDFGLTASLSKTVDIQAPVTAAFTWEADLLDYQTINFMDASVDAVMLLWEFGDGYQFTGMNPSHTYSEDGVYTVTLTAYSVTGKTDVVTEDITVAQGFIATINDPGVEDGSGAWRNSALEASADVFYGIDGTWVTQTSSTSHTGAGSAKLPTVESNGGDEASTRRWIYQAIEVEANTDYDIDFWVRNKDSDAGTTVTVQIYDAPFDDAAIIDNPSNIIATEILNAASGHDVNSWTEAKINFNSGSSTMIVLYIYNDWTLNVAGGDDESESYFDDFLITKL